MGEKEKGGDKICKKQESSAELLRKAGREARDISKDPGPPLLRPRTTVDKQESKRKERQERYHKRVTAGEHMST